jgi:hypothetical protein
MKETLKISSFIIFILLSINIANAQSTTYTYQGNFYDNFTAPYSANSRVTGSIELNAPLAANSTTDISQSLQAFSFTDGQAVRSQTDTTVCDFTVTTDAQGQIVSWSVWLRQNDTGPNENQHSLESISSIPVDQSGFSASLGGTDCSSIALDPSGGANTTPPPNAWQGGPQLEAKAVPALSFGMMMLLALLFLISFVKFLQPDDH